MHTHTSGTYDRKASDQPGHLQSLIVSFCLPEDTCIDWSDKVNTNFKQQNSIIFSRTFLWYFLVFHDMVNMINFQTLFFFSCQLTLNAPIATKVFCFSRLLKCLRSLYGKQCGPRSDCSYRRLFWVQANSSVMQGNYLQQTTPAEDIFRCIIFLALYGLRCWLSWLEIINVCKNSKHTVWSWSARFVLAFSAYN